MRQDDMDDGRRPGTPSSESVELRATRRRIHELETELGSSATVDPNSAGPVDAHHGTRRWAFRTPIVYGLLSENDTVPVVSWSPRREPEWWRVRLSAYPCIRPGELTDHLGYECGARALEHLAASCIGWEEVGQVGCWAMQVRGLVWARCSCAG
jgi:hypothetical protein